MSKENVEVAQRAIAALNGRDIEGYLALCTPAVEVVGPVASLEGTDRGAEGLRHFFSALDEATSNYRLAQSTASVYVFADDKIRRVEVFFDCQDALDG